MLPIAPMPREIVDSARASVAQRLDELLEAVDDAGCDVVEQQYSFSEICHRKRLRWDLRMPDACGAWSALVVGLALENVRSLALMRRGFAEKEA